MPRFTATKQNVASALNVKTPLHTGIPKDLTNVSFLFFYALFYLVFFYWLKGFERYHGTHAALSIGASSNICKVLRVPSVANFIPNLVCYTAFF